VSDKRYYLCEFRLDGRRLYVIWYSNDNDGLVGVSDGKIASSTDERRMNAFCHANNLTLMPEPIVNYDFEKISAWCEHPTAEMVDPVLFLNAWNMLGDAQSLRETDVLSQDDAATGRADKVYAKLLYANNLPALTPQGTRYEPIWLEEELSLLSRIFQTGLAELRARIEFIK
jgi:hypothetical protein